MTIKHYFDKVYVLSLKRNKERRSQVTERLKMVDIDFEFFDACDGQVVKHVWEKFNNPIFSTPNYLACQISHLSIYNDALSNGYNRILILEDDVKPIKEINEKFDIIHHQIPQDYELLYLGWIPLSDDQLRWEYDTINNRFITSNVFLSKNLWGLYAYSPSVELMKEMIDLYNQSFPMEIDRYFVENIQQQRKSYAIRPQLFAHDIGISNNGGFIDNQSLLKSIDHRIARPEDYW